MRCVTRNQVACIQKPSPMILIHPTLRSRALAPLVLLFLALGPGLHSGPIWADTERSFTLQLPSGDTLQLSPNDLAALPLTEFVTSTVWTEGVDRYTGVLLRDLLHHHGIEPGNGTGRVLLTAIDGYSAVIEFDAITERAPMLAFLRNGDIMPLRRQGPFWLIYPYDDDAAFRTETIYALSVWQVDTVNVIRP